MFAKLYCRLFGHRRGKRVGAATDIINGATTFYCPRCNTRWTRKTKVKAAL